ncbi:processed acidic surface protein [Halobacillus mangrovi]|uniref:processed acidic surface protein n=1 Tax=Halobacillus mangrovi TaxID=402384 RepID=UPI003D952DA3
MRGLFLVVLVGFLVALFPGVNYAAPNTNEVESFVAELGWTVQDLVEYLDFYELSLEDFEDMDELKEFLGEPLTEESLNVLLNDYGLSLEEASQLLIENGELEEGQSILDAYTFVEDLDMDLSFYNMTPLTDETLNKLLEDYELSYEELVELFDQNGDSIENYQYVEELDWAVWNYLYSDEEMDYSDIEGLFTDFGLTEEELERLFNHLMELDLEDPAKLEKLDELSTRMMAFADFEVAIELTSEQIAELLDIYTQMMQILDLDASFYLVKEGEKEQVSISTIMAMTSSEGYDLMIVLHNTKGEFLADLLLTGDMFSSELIEDTGKDLEQLEGIQEQVKSTVNSPSVKKEPVKPEPMKPETVENRPVNQTEHGGKLPKTASFAVEKAAGGLAILAVGFLFYRRFKYAQK